MKTTSKTKLYIRILFSFFIAAMLTAATPANFLHWFWPQWLLLVMMFWVLNNHIGFKAAFTLGLLQDALSGSMLGEHGLALIIVTYLLLKFSKRLKLNRPNMQALTIFLLILTFQALLYLLHGIIKNSALPPCYYWLSSITSTFLWPIITILLNNYVRRYNTKTKI
jgi:rod shape-determining protein MreD